MNISYRHVWSHATDPWGPARSGAGNYADIPATEAAVAVSSRLVPGCSTSV